MHGILVFANNPFCSPGKRRKIVILSGFSGVATDALAKLITAEECLPEFLRLDEEFVDVDANFEALVGVRYAVDDTTQGRDTRRIVSPADDIFFEGLVQIDQI